MVQSFTGLLIPVKDFKRLLIDHPEPHLPVGRCVIVSGFNNRIIDAYFGIRESRFGPSDGRIVFSVKLTLTEYIIYIASCIGLWFGFSIFDSICELVCKVRKLIESKSKVKIKSSKYNNHQQHKSKINHV